MEYNFRKIESDWKKYWEEKEIYKVSNDTSKPKCYILDMFPYPSGAGLHVGHPLGYIASDIYGRYKRLCGYNVLHPMGFDAFGLPAEQYAIETGQHPAKTTEQNIKRYKEQLNNIGFCYDWSREVRTSDPQYYKWTQWIFLQLFNSFYNRKEQKAESIDSLINIFEREGNINHPCPGDDTISFNPKTGDHTMKNNSRIFLWSIACAIQHMGEVNWCEALGTVLANDEVVNGVSERGGHPVVKKKLRQWYLRITEYADRLLEGLQKVDFSEAMKEMQSNWIGKSEGAQLEFKIQNSKFKIKAYTTRPDTIFGVDFMVLAPEHELVEQITTTEQKQAVKDYIAYVKSRSERERMAEKKISGVFTGAYAIHPFSGKQIPVWISEYVLAGYGTGAIMAVPSGDERDHKFAQHFNIPITNIFGDAYNGEEANASKDAILHNSDFLDGMTMKDAADVVIGRLVEMGIGKRKVNYKLRDAAFSRQRYWGEPFPIVWKDGIAYPLDENELPVELPYVENYKPGPEGEGPLANVPEWTAKHLETNTMPGYAGSSWYFLRYMDPHNDKEFAARTITDYWREVDIYIGGTEHAVGHLLYSRMWTKLLYDLGHIGFDEPFKKLINQGMIQGSSRLVYRLRIDYLIEWESYNDKFPLVFVSKNIGERIKKIGLSQEEILQLQNWYFELNEHGTTPNFEDIILHRVDISLVDGTELDLNRFINSRPDYKDAKFFLEPDSKFICSTETEKMSKSKYNVVNPDDIVAQYGADTFRMYEMFLGPIEISKPWDTKGIEGVSRFFKKLWRLYFDETKTLDSFIVNNEKATDEELRILHKTIKKIGEDIERFSLNTSVSQFMICVNDLSALNCHKREILEPLAIIIAPFAPHTAEELWHQLGNEGSVLNANFPAYEEKYVTENSKKYPVAVNGKTRVEMEFPLDAAQDAVEKEVLADPTIIKWMEGKSPKKVIFVKGKMINVVV